MNFYLDPHRPHIDGATIRCPDCGQTYDTIIEGWFRLPPRHYRQPTWTSLHGVVVGTEVNARNRQRICPVDSDILVRNLFAAQVAAESERQRSAA